jgi:uncharacterized membrane protein
VTPDDRERIARAIAEAERGTTGRIVVRWLARGGHDAFEHAKREFESAGLHRHPARNAALILVAPRAKSYAVIGDSALHARVGDTFWRRVVDEMRASFARDDIPGGILHAVRQIGNALHEHFAQ